MTELKKLQAVFQTLSDYNRLNIIKSISDKECAVGELVKATGLSQPLVSHHLRTLKENGFLETKRKGPFIYYYLKDLKILYTIDMFIDIFKDTDVKPFQVMFRFCSERIMKKYNYFKK
jgi:DNA-binding transcriptional ArsR family regulator